MNEIMITGIISALTAISGFYYGNRKNKLDVESQILANIQAQVAIYETLIDSLRDEIMILIQKVEDQKKTIGELEQKIEHIYKKNGGQ
jgi:peptidoglycan hydrolase CwlO-like protein